MKTSITAILLGILLTGTVNAGHQGCRNNAGSCKCNCNYTTTLFSTGTYLVDLSKGPVWINFNPRHSGYYEIKIYKKSLAMSLTQCGKRGYVRSTHRKDSCSNSFLAELCNKATYRLYLCKARRSDNTMIVEISRKNSGCSRVKRISSVYSRESQGCLSRVFNIMKKSSSNSCSKKTSRPYHNRNGYHYRSSGNRYYHSNLLKRKKCFSKNSIGFSISF